MASGVVTPRSTGSQMSASYARGKIAAAGERNIATEGRQRIAATESGARSLEQAEHHAGTDGGYIAHEVHGSTVHFHSSVSGLSGYNGTTV